MIQTEEVKDGGNRNGSVPKSDTDGDYLLRRHWVETTRLDLQHYIVTERTGWSIHPRITQDIHKRITAGSTDSSSTVRIADVACGTGAVALKLHEQFPTVSITALDQSSEQFPAPWIVPQNVKFGLQDILYDVPKEYVGAFDVIHIRLIAVIFAQGDPTRAKKVVSNLLTMLKPDGWLNWYEIDILSMYLAGPEDPDFKIVPWVVKDVFGHRLNEENVRFIQDLGKFVGENGFVDVDEFMPMPSLKRGGVQEETRLTLLGIHEQVKTASVRGSKEAAERGRQVVEKLEKDMFDGKQIAYVLRVVTGKKPS